MLANFKTSFALSKAQCIFSGGPSPPAARKKQLARSQSFPLLRSNFALADTRQPTQADSPFPPVIAFKWDLSPAVPFSVRAATAPAAIIAAVALPLNFVMPR